MKITFNLLCICLALASVFQLILLESSKARANESVVTKYDNWLDKKRNRQIPVKYYVPVQSDKFKAPFPVVIFSHGLGGSREAAVYLGEYLSKNGYVGIFIQHPGSDESFWRPESKNEITTFDRNKILDKFKKQLANPVHALNRANDVHFAVDMLELLNKTDNVLKGKLDLDKIAIAGHSYGSWTALTASGQRMVTPFGKEVSSIEPRIKAAVYLSPTYPRKKVDPKIVYGKIQIPGLHFTGTKDKSPLDTGEAEDRRTAFDNISKSDQYLVILDNADHMVFGGRARNRQEPSDKKYQEIVEETTLNFLDAYLKKKNDAKIWLDKKAFAYIKPYGLYQAKHQGSLQVLPIF
ncbi:MAG: alpha/beta fold hydrolase [Candidatus Melainabacteria bacterium]|nr:alpha/beta fold hydrolase [Candidatus Melainabacteria bacterium]